MIDHSRWLAKKLWGLFALLLILTALLVQLGRELLPMVADYRHDIASQISDQVGLPVSIENIEGVWEGLAPQLSIDRLLITTEAGEEVLRVDKALFQLDVLGTVFDQQLNWRKVYLSGVKAALQQKVDGAWTLTGLSMDASEPDDEASGLLDAFNQGRYVEFKDINLQFKFSSGRQRALRLTEMLLENSDDFHRLVADIDLPEQEEAFKVITEGYGDSSDLDSYLFDGHIQFTNFPLSSSAFLSEALADKPLVENGTVNLSLWLTMDKPRELVVSGEAVVDVIDESGHNNQLSATLHGSSNFQTEWSLALQGLNLFWQENQLPPVNLQLTSQNQGKTLSLKADAIDLGVWYTFAEQQQLLEGKLQALFADLNPQGHLENLRVDLPLAEPLEFELQAQLSSVYVGAWNGAPALSNVTGFVRADRQGGWVDLDSQDGFSMHYPQIYTEAMAYKAARGQVAWHLNQDVNQIAVNSGRIELVDQRGRADGYFLLDMPWEADSRPSELILQIGLQDAPAKIYQKYVPFVVDAETRQWLDSSILGGDVSQAGFVYRSYFGDKFDLDGTVQLLVDVDNGQLRYHPDWPEVSQVQARVLEDDADVVVAATEATLLQSRSPGLQVGLSPNAKGQGSLLTIQGQLQGAADNGLDLLRHTPLREAIGDQFDSWQLDGSLSAEVDLAIPLQDQQPGERQTVKVALEKTDLHIGNLKLDAQQVSGQIIYDHRQGLSSRNLKASLWSRPVQVTVATTPKESSSTQAASQLTTVEIVGKVAPKPLAEWTQRPEILFAEGNIPVQARLLLPAKNTADYLAKLELESDLQGVKIDLPAPYGKPAASSRALSVDIPIYEESTQYQLSYGNQIFAYFSQHKDVLAYGEIALDTSIDGAEFSRQAKTLYQANSPTLRVKGKADKVVLSQWQQVLNRYNLYTEQLNASLSAAQSDQIDVNADDLAQHVDLHINLLEIGEFALPDLQLQGERIERAWLLKPTNEILAGEIIVFDDDSPMQLNLDYLQLEGDSQTGNLQSETVKGDKIEDDMVKTGIVEAIAEQSQIQAQDPFAEIDPADLIALDVNVGKFSIGAEDYGSWAFKLRPSADKIHVKSILGHFRGMLISGEGPDASVEIVEENQGADLYWTVKGGEVNTHFSGRLSSQNFGDVMEAWNQPRSLESKYAVFDMDIKWPGSPAAIDLKTVEGVVGLDIDKGVFSKTAGAGSSALLRLMGLFNFDSWARRLKLDFSDTYRSGTAFDRIEGKLKFDQGIVVLTEPMMVKTPSARLSMAGSIDTLNEQLDTTLVATLPVGGNLTVIAAFAGGLPAAAGVYAISKIFKRQVDKVASVSYSMQGPWDNPEIQFDRLFDSKGAERAGSNAKTKMDTRKADSSTAVSNGSE